jgi:hypothetical protein
MLDAAPSARGPRGASFASEDSGSCGNGLVWARKGRQKGRQGTLSALWTDFEQYLQHAGRGGALQSLHTR